MELNLIKPRNDEYTKHLKLTEQELAELKRSSQEAAVFLATYFREKYAVGYPEKAKNEKRE